MQESTLRRIANRYHLQEKLGQGSMGAVYKAYDRLTGHTIALKRVLLSSQQLILSSIHDATTAELALAREFQTLASLRHPNIIEVLDYGFDQSQQPYFTMTYLEDAEDIIGASKHLDSHEKVELLVQVLQALDYLHRRGVIHRDVKPANVLIDKEDNVKVLDFGVAVLDDEEKRVVGTVAYMAPEILRGEGATRISDLYSVGVIAYVMFVGQHPFDISTKVKLINEIMGVNPDFSKFPASLTGTQIAETPQKLAGASEYPTSQLDDTTIFSDDIDRTVIADNLPRGTTTSTTLPNMPLFDMPEPHPMTGDLSLVGIIARLLAKDPVNRYQSAAEVIVDLCTAIGKPIPPETAAIRESYLQTAKFVGRTAEMIQLSDALEKAIKSTGSAWLIAGESGIGKSRLLDELRIRALVEGALVIRGQSVEGGGLPYQLWRTIVRRVLLDVDVNDTDASILKEVVSDMGELLNRTIPDAPELPGNARQQRLAQAIVRLFKAHTMPVVLLLEDLHWAKESLAPIRELNSIVEHLPLLLVATFRDDEQPDLLNQLPGMYSMKLQPLSRTHIADLSASILGSSANQQQVVDFLERETEGNALFLVEVLRSLAERAGSISQILVNELPEEVFTGGVEAVLRRRLTLVPEWGMELLKLAAIYGRQQDLTILIDLNDGEIELNAWLDMCVNASILEYKEGDWRFTHDKLRRVIIDDLKLAEPSYHRRVAFSIELFYPEDRAQATILAGHWREAKVPEKEIVQAAYAAQQAMENGELVGARHYYERILELFRIVKKRDLHKDVPSSAWVYSQLAETFYGLGDYDKAVKMAEEAVDLTAHAKHPAARSRALTLLGNVRVAQGDYEAGQHLLEQAVAVGLEYGDMLETGKSMRSLGVCLMIQSRHDQAKRFFDDSLRMLQDVGDLMGVAGTLTNLAQIAQYFGEYQEAYDLLGKSLEQFEAIDFQWGTAFTKITLGRVLTRLGKYKEAQDINANAVKICRAIRHRWGTAYGLSQWGDADFFAGDFEASRQHLLEAIAIGMDINTQPLVLDALTCLARLETPEIAVQMLAHAASNTLHDTETLDAALNWLDDFKAQMPAEAYQEAYDAGQAASLETIVALANRP